MASRFVSSFRTLDADISGNTVVVRGDLNVPVENGAVPNATRIERTLPTLSELTIRTRKAYFPISARTSGVTKARP